MWSVRLLDVSRSRRGPGAAMSVWLGVALSLAGCQDGYPIAATRCDRLCDLTQETQCGVYSPAACVVGCEAQVWGGAACYPEFDVLLACLEIHRSAIHRSDGASCGDLTTSTIAECDKAQTALALCAVDSQGVPRSSIVGGTGTE